MRLNRRDIFMKFDMEERKKRASVRWNGQNDEKWTRFPGTKFDISFALNDGTHNNQAHNTYTLKGHYTAAEKAKTYAEHICDKILFRKCGSQAIHRKWIRFVKIDTWLLHVLNHLQADIFTNGIYFMWFFLVPSCFVDTVINLHLDRMYRFIRCDEAFSINV